jgi:hydrogenase nickel incorporation protein HypA/HybF
MHEVALAQGILDVVLDFAHGRQARSVRVRAGEMLGVSPDSLQFGFELVARNTSADGAQLEVAIVPGDTLLIDAIELDDGWLYRQDVAETVVT